MERLEGLMTELTEREIESWPRDRPVVLHERLQRLTLEIVLRAVFGLERGAKLDRLRELLTEVLQFAENPISLLPFAQRMLAGRGPMGRLERLGEEADRLIFELIDERRGGEEGGPDVLALLLSARHEDGSPMSDAELRDELVTALVAGHETTASQLSWGFEMLSRNPRVVERLAREFEAGGDDAYVSATIQEIMRRKPVLMNAEPRLVKQRVEIGGVSYPPGVVLIASAFLVHHDPAIYPDPYSFRPERFMESEGGQAPGTYTWLPFGGGRRRCLGASFAMLEMKIVLRAVIERNVLFPVGDRPETARRRSITISPSRGCEIELRARPGSKGKSAVAEQIPVLA
jgi:cytochrome P450